MQAQSTPTGNSIQKDKPASSGLSQVTSKEIAGPAAVAPQPAPIITYEPTRPPNVTWDGKQLTIDAENSSLGDVLNAVRAQTGASIDMPGTVSAERVFVHLGPGPPRDILSSLLYGVPFDYVVETADDDPDTLRKVVLTAQGLSDGDVVAAGAADTGGGAAIEGSTLHRGGGDGRAGPGVRMMPGWAGPGLPSFQADSEAALETQRAAQEAAAPAVAQDSTGGQDSAVVPDSPAQQSAVSKDSAVSADAEGARASNASPSTADSGDTSGIGSAIQSMTQMFEQRRQLQSQQNQKPRQQQSPAD